MSRKHEGGYRSTRITTATTTVLKGSSGVLIRLALEAVSAGTITVSDSTGSRLVLPVGATPASYNARRLGLGCVGQLAIVTSAADRVVAVWD